MTHVRQQIREVVTAAVTGLSTTGARVFQSRVYPLEEADLPGLLVYSQSEPAAPATINTPRFLDRTYTLIVQAVAAATLALDDELDAICQEVEAALANPLASLLSLARVITLTGTEFDLQGTAEQPVGTATMTFEVAYSTAEGAPDTAL